MDCRNCQPTLIDLLYGELATDAAEQAHAHLKQCANCRSAYDKLAKGRQFAQQVPLLEPPQAVGARLLQLAEQHARAAAAQTQQARKPAPPWQSLIEFIGRFAMARQVGMATIMLLIVAVGLWSLPQLERAPVADGGTVVNPEPSGEAAPSAGVQPAQPLDLQVDLRSGRIRSKDEHSDVAADQAQEVPGAAPAATVAEGVRTGASGDNHASEELARMGELAATRENANAKPSARARRSVESKKSAGGLEPFAERADSDKLDHKGAGAGPSGRAEQERAEKRAFPASAAPSPPAAATASKPARAPAPQPAADAELDGLAGVKESAAGSLRAESSVAAEAPAQAPAKQKASADSAAADCSTSFDRYERIIEAAPDSAQAGEALLAMARCLNVRGERARARALLERAARNPHVADRAKVLLDAPAPAETRSNPYKR
jgi:hypothetical protein